MRKSKSKVVDRKRTEKRKTERKKIQRKSTVKKKKVKKQLARKTTQKRVVKKQASQRSQPAVKKNIPAQIPQDKQEKTQEETAETLEGNFSNRLDERKKKKTEKKPKQKKIVEDKTEVVVASLPDTSVETTEESTQETLSRFSKNISSLKSNLKNTSGNPEALLSKLGDAYLEAQRFMDSQKENEERQNLLELSSNGGLLLGSYEQAAWAYKLALNFNRKNAKTHLKIGRIYDEMGDGRNALMYAKLAHQIFKRNDNSGQMKETQSFIDLLAAKYENKSGKKVVHKG